MAGLLKLWWLVRRGARPFKGWSLPPSLQLHSELEACFWCLNFDYRCYASLETRRGRVRRMRWLLVRPRHVCGDLPGSILKPRGDASRWIGVPQVVRDLLGEPLSIANAGFPGGVKLPSQFEKIAEAVLLLCRENDRLLEVEKRGGVAHGAEAASPDADVNAQPEGAV